MSDTRKDKRASLPLKVRFKSATVDEFIEQYAKNISRGGIFINTKDPLPVGTLLKFEIQLKDESPIINGVGRVVWKRSPGDGSHGEAPAGMGIKFIRMDPECRATVERIAAQRGDTPGQYEAGGGFDDAPASAPPPAQDPGFFPSAGPSEAELPPPEDRTQVRHASEFLASALAEGGAGEAAAEAEQKIDEARRRADEAKARAAEAAHRSSPGTLRSEPPKSSKREVEPPPVASDEDDAVTVAAPNPRAMLSNPVPAEPVSDEAKTRPVVPARRELAAPRSVPPEPPKSYAAPVATALIALIAGGAYWWSQQTPANPVTPSTQVASPTPSALEPAPSPSQAQTEVPAPEGTTAAPVPAEQTPTAPTPVAPSPVAPTPAAVATHPVRVETTPLGAAVFVDGVPSGTTPTEVSIPEGRDAVVTARLVGYREGSATARGTSGARPVRITLAALRHIVEVTGVPAGTRLRAASPRSAGANATATSGPTRMLVGVPQDTVTITATNPAFLDATATLAPTDFREQEGVMLASVSIAMQPRPRPAPPPVRARPASSAGTPPSTPDSPSEEAPSAPPTEAAEAPAPSPTPAPPPAAEEAPPANPF
jgi:uncharacterized protein (TIGR02266 family)